MSRAFLGELVGTAMLILLGNGVVAGVQLKGSYAENSGWLVITTAWGIVVTCSVLVALAIGSNAHINPAVTIGMAFYERSWNHVPVYLAGQFLGAFIGACLVWLHYLPHWGPTEDAAAKRSCFCTSPAIKHTPSNLFSEITGSFVLIFVVAAIYSGNITADGLTPGFGPFLVGLLVWAIGLCLGGTTGYAINPARDLGPRVAHALLPIAGKGGSGWDYAPIPVIGPIIGGSLGGLLAVALGI
jgi:glycerol uptake facilitator protein